MKFQILNLKINEEKMKNYIEENNAKVRGANREDYSWYLSLNLNVLHSAGK